MTNTIDEIMKQYSSSSLEESKFALREMIQSIILIGLSRGGFFKYASFYGGTALRFFYGLNRYSEDLDFTLNEPSDCFKIEKYADSIKTVAFSYGLDLEISFKSKKVASPIESAFAKLNTYQTFISLKLSEKMKDILHKDEIIKVKFEVDCLPSLGFNTETKWIDNPEFAPIIVLDESSLFAGKLHALLCRTYKNNVKGRDYYDFLFYVSKNIKPNMLYLKNKLVASGKVKENGPFNISILKSMLREKFFTVDFESVKKDASKFICKQEDLSFYCQELFLQMIDKIQ